MFPVRKRIFLSADPFSVQRGFQKPLLLELFWKKMLRIFDWIVLRGRRTRGLRFRPLVNHRNKGTPLDPEINVQSAQLSDPPSGTWLENFLVPNRRFLRKRRRRDESPLGTDSGKANLKFSPHAKRVPYGNSPVTPHVRKRSNTFSARAHDDARTDSREKFSKEPPGSFESGMIHHFHLR